MTVTVQETAAGPYFPNGVAASFRFEFKVPSADELMVVRRDTTTGVETLVSSGAYTVSFDVDGEGGSADFTVPPAALGGELWVYMDPDFTQQANFTNNGFLPNTLNPQFDRAALRDLWLKDRLSRAILMPPGSDGLVLSGVDVDGTFGVDASGDAAFLPRSAFQGDPGGNVMAIGLFTAGPTLLIPAGTDLVQTSGYSVAGRGHALYVADVLVDAAWVAAHPRGGFVSANGRGFRLSHQQQLDVMMFGATGDGVTVDFPAFVAAQDYIGSQKRAGYAYNNGVMSCRVPFGVYNFAGNAFDVRYSIHWFGDGSDISNAASVLLWNNTSSGLRIHYIDTAGDTGTQAPIGNSGSGSTFERLHLEGGYAGGDEAERHAVIVRAKCTFNYCNFFNWAGDAFRLNATTVGVVKGNANLVTSTDCLAQNCRSGWMATGNDDVNACRVTGWDAIINRRWGIEDRSFLGNQFFGGHFDANARTAWNTGAANRPCSYVTQGGNRYFVIDEQEVWASANAPTGTTADNTGWAYWQAGGVTTGVPAWFAGIAVRSGGPIRAWGLNAATTVVGPHVEINGVSQYDQYCTVVGASTAEAVKVSLGILNRDRLGRIRAVGGGMRVDGTLESTGGLYGNAPTNILGPSSGATVQDGVITLASRNVQNVLQWQIFDSVGNPGAVYASIGGYSGLGLIYDTTAPRWHRFRVGALDVCHVETDGLVYDADKGTIGSNTAAPTTGTHPRGKIVWNSQPAAAGKVGWVCVTAGTPGTWKAFGVIDA